MTRQTRTFWLSFIDPDGGCDLGICVVDVSEADVAASRAALSARDLPVRVLPHGADWVVAAVYKAHLRGCNPGGVVTFYEIPSSNLIPRDRLIQPRELARWTTQRVH